ncbi:hypothetical protein PO909_006778 [Leuciscus waleckii]
MHILPEDEGRGAAHPLRSKEGGHLVVVGWKEEEDILASSGWRGEPVWRCWGGWRGGPNMGRMEVVEATASANSDMNAPFPDHAALALADGDCPHCELVTAYGDSEDSPGILLRDCSSAPPQPAKLAGSPACLACLGTIPVLPLFEPRKPRRSQGMSGAGGHGASFLSPSVQAAQTAPLTREAGSGRSGEFPFHERPEFESRSSGS